MEPDPVKRFTARVDDYARYRPGYPPELAAWLAGECGLTPQSRVADIGSGTGIFSGVFLRFGCEVFGVEPNSGMRAAAERLLAGEPRFHSIDGRAEATTLADHSVDLVAAAQAFHWFLPDPTRAEFRRILKPGGWVVLVWNERLVTPGFLAEYEDMLQRLSTDYGRVDHRRVDADHIAQFFQHDRWRSAAFPNNQDLDWEGLRGRLLSSSYAPLPDSPKYAPMMAELEQMYRRYHQNSMVRVLYETKVYAGQLT